MNDSPAPEGRAPPLEKAEPAPLRVKSGGLTLRGVTLALVAQALILVWVVRSEITARVFVSSWSLCMPGLLLLIALRVAAARREARALSQGELLTCYVVTSTTVMLVGYNFMQLMLPSLGAPFAFAAPTNNWERLWPFIPEWLAPRDPEVLRGLFQGQSAVPWRAWLVPLLAWGSLIFALAMATLALNLLLAPSWIRQERLAFPMAALPLEVSAAGGAFWRNRLLWLGIAVPTLLQSLLALNYYIPAVPAIFLKHRDVAEEWVNPPVSVLRPVLVGFTPFIVGLAFLAPLDISFSVWFFQWLTKVQRLIAFLYGWVDATDLGSRGEPHLDDQTVGAFLTLGVVLLWRALRSTSAEARRRPASRRMENAKTRTSLTRCEASRKGETADRNKTEFTTEDTESTETDHRKSDHGTALPAFSVSSVTSVVNSSLRAFALSRRFASRQRRARLRVPSPGLLPGALLAVCLAYILFFFTAAGFSPGVAAAILALYLLTVTVIARVRAEAGFAWTYGPDRFTASLGHIMVNTAGTTAFAPRSLALLGLFHWLWWDLRFAPMPAQMEALKIGDSVGLRRRGLACLIAAATLLALLVGFYACLVDSYRFGWATAHVYAGPAQGARIGPTLAVQWMENPRLPDGARVAWMGLGGGVTLLLSLARQRFFWWPFHPIGYVMSATATSHAFWSHYLMAWTIKLLILRYGGMRLYRRALPFVLGVILGDVLTQSLWSLACSLLDVPVYQFVS